MLTSLTNIPRDYDWGSTTLIPDLTGRPVTGKPEAEIWFGDHPSSPARVEDGRTLTEALADAGEPSLPYLLKLLAAGKSLSIQVHPSKQQAEAGFAREAALAADDPTRNYHDANHKPELIVAISDRFEALAGLREPAQTLRLLAAFGDNAGAEAIAERLRGADPAAALADTIAWLLSPDAVDAVATFSAELPAVTSDEFGQELTVLTRIAQTFPGDAGIAVAALMNLVVLRRGEGIYLRAGLLHTYQAGLGVEIMATSDNVLRGGLTPKRVDVPELLALVDTAPGTVPVLHPAAVAGVAGLGDYGPGVVDFALAVAHPGDGEVVFDVSGPTTVLATAGTVTVSVDGQTRTLAAGDAALALQPASAVHLHGAGEAFIATAGDAAPVAPRI